MATSTAGTCGSTPASAGDRIDRLAATAAMAAAAGLVAGAGAVSVLQPSVAAWAFAGGTAAVALTWMLSGAVADDPLASAPLPARAAPTGRRRVPAADPPDRDRQVVADLLALAERIRAVPAPGRPTGEVTTVGGPAAR